MLVACALALAWPLAAFLSRPAVQVACSAFWPSTARLRAVNRLLVVFDLVACVFALVSRVARRFYNLPEPGAGRSPAGAERSGA